MMLGRTVLRTLSWFVLVLPCAALAAEPVVVKPDSGPGSAIEIKRALDEFMMVSDECNSAAGDTMTCICGEAAVVQRLNASLESALESHPDWRKRPLQYKGFEQDSTLQIMIPALQQQMSGMMTRCDG